VTGLLNSIRTPRGGPQPENGGKRPRGTLAAAAEAYRRLEGRRLRRYLRESSAVLIISAAIAGSMGGAAASLMLSTANFFHILLFGLPDDMRLSAATALDWRTMLAALLTGGMLLGLSAIWWRKRIAAIADPIEANALHGGRMSTADSLFVAGQCVVSSAAGASVGLEGGYTQLAWAPRLEVGAADSPPAPRCTHAGGSRNGRGYSGRFQRSVCRCRLRFRADYRQLHHGDVGACGCILSGWSSDRQTSHRPRLPH
jgi:hypothetical protein